MSTRHAPLPSPPVSDGLVIVIDVWSHPGYRTGLVAGLIGASLVLVIASILRCRVYGWSLIFAVAVVVALSRRTEIDGDFVLRLGVLAAAGLLVDLTMLVRWEWRWTLTTAAWTVAFIAAFWFGEGAPIESPSWMSFGLPLTVVGLAVGLWAWGRLPEARLAGPLAAMAIAGAWVTVPETDLIVVLLGVALPMGLVTLLPFGGRPSAAGAMAVAGVFAWLVLHQGIPRPWTVVASWALVAAIPAMAGLVSRGLARPGPITTLVIYFLFVVAVTRVADYTDSVPWVVVWSAVALALAGVGFLLTGPPAPYGDPVSS